MRAVWQVFVESGQAVCFEGTTKLQMLRDGSFFAEESFVRTLSMMVEENGDVNVQAAAGTQRIYGLQAVTDCHCLELGIKDVFEAFEGNRDVLRLLTRWPSPARAGARVSERERTRSADAGLCAHTCFFDSPAHPRTPYAEALGMALAAWRICPWPASGSSSSRRTLRRWGRRHHQGWQRRNRPRRSCGASRGSRN